MGVWHRYVLRRAGVARGDAVDAGMTIVEILIAIVILSVGLLGLAGVLATSLKAQKVENSQVAANHLADSWFAYEESLTHPGTPGSLPVEGTVGSATAGAVNTSFTQVVNQPANPKPVVSGITYTELWTPLICPASAIDSGSFTLTTSSCRGTGSPGPGDTVFGTFKITWKVGTSAHQLSITRNLADNTTYVPAATNANGTSPIALCTRSGTATGTLGSIPATTSKYVKGSPTNPGPIDLGGSNNPLTYTDNTTGATDQISATTGGSWVDFTLSETGLGNTAGGSPSCIPLTWIDSTSSNGGFHQVDMHLTSTSCTVGTACSYSADIPFSEMTQTTASPTWDNEIDFYALYNGTVPPSSSACPASANCSTNFTKYPFQVDSVPSLTAGSCTANSNGVIGLLGLLGLNSVEPGTQATIFKGAGTNMNTGTTVTVTYQQTSGAQATFTFILSSNNTAWTLTPPNAVTYNISIAKGVITPTVRAGALTLGLPVIPFANSFSYTATRNDGKTATCGPVATAVYG
ncbi:MAG TPA: prepilin-type N-terminal cleavage/methylation domain-containing protein [Mycobacteriales bacterium]|nr:prepilin-type N-terminal cleavage/methylation domain-containing protein [Mycobacteriales bacterium]